MRTRRVRHREALCAAKNLVLSAKAKRIKRLAWFFLFWGGEMRTRRVRYREALAKQESRPLSKKSCKTKSCGSFALERARFER